MKSITITRELLADNLDFFDITLDQIKPDEESFEVIPQSEVFRLVERLHDQSKEVHDLRAKMQAFTMASENLGKLLDFKNSPMSATTKLIDIINKPEKYQKELGPILKILNVEKNG